MARDWHELFPTQIDGVPTQSYYHWLALAYASAVLRWMSGWWESH